MADGVAWQFAGFPTGNFDHFIGSALQASSNTLLAHFISIVLAQWLLRVLNKGAQPAGQAA